MWLYSDMPSWVMIFFALKVLLHNVFMKIIVMAPQLLLSWWPSTSGTPSTPPSTSSGRRKRLEGRTATRASGETTNESELCWLTTGIRRSNRLIHFYNLDLKILST